MRALYKRTKGKASNVQDRLYHKNVFCISNRKAYFYVDENGNMFVRAGCWFSDMVAFKERVKEVHAGTIHEKTYLAACELAELMLKGGNEE